MKNILIIILITGCHFTVWCQLPTVVSAPILEGTAATQASTLSIMSGTMAALKASEEQVRTIMRTATWARDLVTVRKLIGMIENTICLTRGLQVKMGAFSGSCLYQFEFDMQLLNIGFAADQLGLVIANGVEMTTGERLAQIDNALAKFHKAQMSLSNLNGWLDRELRRKAQQQRVASNVDFMFNVRPSGR